MFTETSQFPNHVPTPQSSYSNMQSQTPTFNHHSNTFDAQAFKEAAAKVAAHNNNLKYTSTSSPFLPPSTSSTPITSSSAPFDPFAAAKENRTRHASTFPPNTNKSKRGRAGSSGSTSTRSRGRISSDTPAYDASSPVITFLCGFEIFKASKWAKQKPISVTRTIDIYRPEAYEDLRLDLWTHFQNVFVPNDIIDSLPPAGFAFTTLGSQDGSVTNTDLQWWFSQNSSISIIFDHSRYEHSLTLKKSDHPQTLDISTITEEVTKKPNTVICNRALSLLHTTEDNTVQGIERFGRSTQPLLVYTPRAISWITGLQWTVQEDGNMVEADFAAYHWHLGEQQKDGRTHSVQSIDLWHPDGPTTFISKSAIKNFFTLRIVAPTNTSRLYNAVDILLRQFVTYAQTVPGLSDHTELWKTINELRLVKHTIITSERPPDYDDLSHIPDVEGPHEVMHVEEALDQPLKSFATSGFFGFAMIDKPSNMHYLMDAFCHWTYQNSNGHRFVTDLRGSGSVVTNPQIHDADPVNVWGSRNGRAAAVALMPDQHQCQLGCQLLKLPKQVRIPVTIPSADSIWQHQVQLPDGRKIEAGHVDLPAFLSASASLTSRKTPSAPPAIHF